MFSSEAESGDQNAGCMPIPTRFFWPYGGRRVFLTGSFTRWSEHLPMSPMEGCPTVFQAICSLSPGFHQYKFFVDGEWRHDERQPFVTGNYGLVNTVLLTRDPNPVPPPASPDTPTNGASMDIDNETFQRVVTVSGGTPQGDSLRVSDAEITLSRHKISTFLSAHTAYDLLPDSGKVIVFDVNLPVKQAFHILYEQDIPVAPLWDFPRGKFVGVLSALDFILILRELGNHGSNLTEEELEAHTISAWKEEKHRLFGPVDDRGRKIKRDLVHMGPHDTLAEVARKILQNNVATIPIINSSLKDSSYPQLLHLASLTGILKCLCRHLRHSAYSLPILQQPICSFPVGAWVPKIGETNARPLAILRSTASLSSALSLLVEAGVSSIPIVDENDALVDIYSRSDITSLAKDKVYAQVHLNEMSVHQALQHGQDASSPVGLFNGQRCHVCLRTDPLQKVMEKLANPGVRRVIVVQAGSKRVEGIVSLGDIFRFLLG